MRDVEKATWKDILKAFIIFWAGMASLVFFLWLTIQILK